MSCCGFFAARSLSTCSTSTVPLDVPPPEVEAVDVGLLAPPDAPLEALPEGAGAAWASPLPNGWRILLTMVPRKLMALSFA